MDNIPASPNSREVVKLLKRVVHLRSHFKQIVPEDISVWREKIQAASFSEKSGGVTPGLFIIAGTIFLNHEEPITMSEFSHDLEVPLSTATRTMDWFVNNGYAQRLADPNDRRVVRVELTGTGKDTFKMLNLYVKEKVEQALSQLSTVERETFLSLLNKVLDAFEATPE
jgi:DNA-binding MarR family transcriptional regulator